MLDPTALALVGACGDASQVVSLGLKLIPKKIAGAKPNTTHYMLNECIDLTDDTIRTLVQYHNCISHTLTGQKAFQELYQTFKENTQDLERLLAYYAGPSKATKIKKVCNFFMEAAGMDKRRREVSLLQEAIVLHMMKVKVRTSSALGDNIDVRSRVAVKRLEELEKELEKETEAICGLHDSARKECVEKIARKYLEGESLEIWIEKWVNSHLVTQPPSAARLTRSPTALRRRVSTPSFHGAELELNTVDSHRVGSRNPFESDSADAQSSIEVPLTCTS